MAAGRPTPLLEVELTPGVWTDITSRWDWNTNKAVVRRGRQSKATESQPGSFSVRLDNVDGALTPDSPLSTFYPNWIEGKRLRYTLSKGASTSRRFLGRITSILPTIADAGPSSSVDLAAVDQLGDLQAMTLSTPLQMIVLDDSPIAYWPMTEPAGATQFSNIVPGSTIGPLQISRRGTDGSLTLASAPGPTVEGLQAPAFAPKDNSNAVIVSTAEQSLPIGTDLTMECWFTTSTVPPVNNSSNPPLLALSTRKAPAFLDDYILVECSLDRTGLGPPPFDSCTGGHQWASGTGYGGFLQYSTPADGNLHHVVYTEQLSGGTVTARTYVDNILTGQYTFSYTSGGATDRQYWKRLSVGGLYGSSTYQNVFTGSISHVALYNYALSATQIRDHYASGMPVPTGDTLDNQLSRLSSITGVTCGFPSTSGKAGVLPAMNGKSAFDVLLAIARGESGIVYADYTAGTVVCRLRSAARPTAVSMTVDAQLDAGGGPGLTRSNTGRVSRGEAKTPSSSVLASDATLLAQIGPVTRTADVTLADPVELLSVASQAISDVRDTKLRVSSLPLDLSTAEHDLYTSFWALLPGDRLRYTSLPSSHLGYTYLDQYAEGWTETLDINGYVVQFDLSTADAPPEGRFDDATYGRFAWGDGAATITSGTAVGATGNGTLVITTPTGPCLTVDPTMYPLDLDWNGERVTIGAAPASATSPQTVTTTARGVGNTVARSHAAGEAVDVWFAARAAF